MQRKILAISTVALIFLLTVAIHLAATQVALAQEGAATGGEPLPQPMRITFRQSIPLSLTLTMAAPLAASEDLTTEAASALVGTLLNNIAATGAVTGTPPTDAAAVEATDALTGAAEIEATSVVTPPAPAEYGLVLTVEFDVVVTDTLTTTVPTLVTLEMAGGISATTTLSATLAPTDDGELVVELIPVVTPEPTATAIVTPTAEATPEVVTPTVAATPEVTVTVTAEPTPATVTTIPASIGDLAVIATTTIVTSNLRSGPGTNFDQVDQVGPETPVGLVAISEDGQWYLLTSGAWIAGFLVADQPTTLPIATQQIIDQVTAAAAAAPAATAEATSAATAAGTAEPTPESTPTPAAAPAAPATVTTNANVRGGPGTDFPIVGGTVTGQTINIIGRNADSTWFLLDFGGGAVGWVSAELVANAPAVDTLPVFNADGTPAAAAPTATPAAGGGLTLPTPTPVAPAAEITATASTTTTGTTTSAADPATTAYLNNVTTLINSYDAALVSLDTLIAEARANGSRLTDAAWGARLATSVSQLRQANATVAELQAPAALAAVQENIVAAARQYNLAANALEEASTTGATALIDTADQAIQAANASLTAAETAIRQASQQ